MTPGSLSWREMVGAFLAGLAGAAVFHLLARVL